ncbi:hypothetical protein [Bradyrhizobium ottawaense]|uniref:hypothetical protein n=1 Tax=Bradyrhizobium ottawaense TaxID=931866 RepID=UPI00384B13A7
MSRDQVFGLLRNLKWFVVLSLVFSAILSLPAQIVELYRISYADLKFLNLVLLWLTLLLVGSLIWFGSAMVVLESRARLSGKPTRMFNWTARFAPIVLGALPLIAGAAGHFGAIPLRLGEADAKLNEIYNAPGSAFDKFDASLAISVGQSLHRSGYAVLFLTLLAACLWYAVGKGHAADPSYVQRFRSRSFLLGTIGLILATTAIFAVGPTGVCRRARALRRPRALRRLHHRVLYLCEPHYRPFAHAVVAAVSRPGGRPVLDRLQRQPRHPDTGRSGTGVGP